jgi:hypothetical protein
MALYWPVSVPRRVDIAAGSMPVMKKHAYNSWVVLLVQLVVQCEWVACLQESRRILFSLAVVIREKNNVWLTGDQRIIHDSSHSLRSGNNKYSAEGSN